LEVEMGLEFLVPGENWRRDIVFKRRRGWRLQVDS
jgi:hypothetical protein